MIKLHCSACEKFIRNLNKGEPTTDELCTTCQNKITTVFKEIDSANSKFHNEIEAQFDESRKAYEKFMQLNKTKHAQVDIITREIKATVQDMIREILQEKKREKTKLPNMQQ